MIAGLILVSAAIGALLLQVPAASTLAAYFPSGALLYLETRDFAGLLRDWNTSEEKKLWLESANYEVFSRSRLFWRLDEARQGFAAAAGVPPSMALAERVAGAESAIAIYDIGRLEFLYITRLAAASAMQNALWQRRSQFEPRNAGGFDYFVRSESGSGRTAAFAAARDLLLLGTREDLVSGALVLLAGQASVNLQADPWYAQTVKAAGSTGELRLVLNMTGLLRVPHFRSYWIQRNVSSLRQFSSAVVDCDRATGEVIERRILLRGEAVQADSSAESAVGALAVLVPPNAGVYRIVTRPSTEALDAIVPAAGPPPPPVDSGGLDLERRIDEPPLERSGGRFQLSAQLGGNTVSALLEVFASRVLADGVFVEHDRLAVLLGAADWTSVPSIPGWTAERRGRMLFVANREPLLRASIARVGAAAPPVRASYIAEYRHSRELENYTRMMRLIDFPQRAQMAGPNEPAFFSENLASMGRTLARVQTARVEARDRGAQLDVTVRYALR
jgi:hypothetical protein